MQTWRDVDGIGCTPSIVVLSETSHRPGWMAVCAWAEAAANDRPRAAAMTNDFIDAPRFPSLELCLAGTTTISSKKPAGTIGDRSRGPIEGLFLEAYQ